MAKKESIKDKLNIKPKKKEKREITERTPYDVWENMDRMFDRFRTNLDDLFLSTYGSPTELSEYRAPSTDIADHGDRYEVNAEIPGVPKEDINIEVTPNNIEISAEHKESEEEKKKNWLRRERRSTSFYRNFDLPEEINSDEVEAEFNDGILSIMLPKVEPKPKKKSRTVDIK